MLTPVGLIGLFLSLLAWFVASERSTPNRLYLFLSLLALHIAACVAYYLYAQTAPADSSLYYYDYYDMERWKFGLGTVFTVQLVQFLRQTIGGTYFDHFLIFQAIGFWGIALLMRTLQETHMKLGVEQSSFSYVLLFLPGVHFWTSAIGKDAPLFFAVSLAAWSVMQLGSRFYYFALALGVMMLFRPHIALLTVAALAAAEIFNARSHPLRKLGLLIVASAGFAVIAGTVETTFNVDVTSAASVSSFFESRQAAAQDIGGTTAVVGASYPVKLLSLLFRPFFFDAQGAFALVASLENLVYVVVIGFVLFNLPLAISLSKRVFFLRFAISFATLLTLLLAVVYYNVGLGARQKTMIVPTLFSFFAALWAVRSHGLYKGPVHHSSPASAAALQEIRRQKHA